jgi:hypothetical protein
VVCTIVLDSAFILLWFWNLALILYRRRAVLMSLQKLTCIEQLDILIGSGVPRRPRVRVGVKQSEHQLDFPSVRKHLQSSTIPSVLQSVHETSTI